MEGCLSYIIMIIGASGIAFLFWPQMRLVGIFIILSFILAIIISSLSQKKKKEENAGNKQKISAIQAVLSIVLAITIISSLGITISKIASDKGSGGSSSSSVRCGYCGRSFPSNSSDGKCIARTHLCSNCNNNRKHLNDALGK